MQRAEDGAIGPIEILLVEDTSVDAQLVQKALQESTLPLHLTVIENGEHALAFVRRRAPYAESASNSRGLCSERSVLHLQLGIPATEGGG
jgi:CheY-like chemotaxis protein